MAQRFESGSSDPTAADPLVLAGAEFDKCTFLACDFTEASLRRAKFYDCVFERCELPMADLTEVTLRAVEFRTCRLTGVDFTGIAKDPLGVLATFIGCDLRYALFRRLDLTQFSFEDTTLVRAGFERCKLSGVHFGGCDLAGCSFDDCDLSGADLRSARNYHVSPFRNRVKGMRVALPEALSMLGALDLDLN